MSFEIPITSMTSNPNSVNAVDRSKERTHYIAMKNGDGDPRDRQKVASNSQMIVYQVMTQ